MAKRLAPQPPPRPRDVLARLAAVEEYIRKARNRIGEPGFSAPVTPPVPALIWAAIDLDSEGHGHLSAYAAAPPEFAMDTNFCYLRGAVKWISGFDPNSDSVVIPGGAPSQVPRQLPDVYVRQGSDSPGSTSPRVGFTDSNGFLGINDWNGGSPVGTFGIFFLDGLSYSIT